MPVLYDLDSKKGELTLVLDKSREYLLCPSEVVHQEDSDISNDPSLAQTNNTCSSFLDPNHSHFILVDNGTTYKENTEIHLRLKLEDILDKKWEKSESM